VEIVPETKRVKKEIPIRGEMITVEGSENVCPLCGEVLPFQMMTKLRTKC
jgi:hypothetical protein